MFNRKTNIFILLFILIIISAWACYWIITNNGKEEVATDENDYEEMALEEELRVMRNACNGLNACCNRSTVTYSMDPAKTVVLVRSGNHAGNPAVFIRTP